ncbi:MAG: zinc ribbon domain-containing protein [Anaerolineae bacterium]|nr:zinc ribbon domain-containing protein [Anaerolineae bacterium]
MMPLYEYRCANCDTRFEVLRPMSQADDPVACPYCAELTGRRLISLFAAVGKDASGNSRLVAGSASSCGSCAGGHCSTCGH